MANKFPKILMRKHRADEAVEVKTKCMFTVYEHFNALVWDEDGEIDWPESNNILAPKLALKFFPGFHETKTGRGREKDRSSLIADVERVRGEKGGRTITHACNTLQVRGSYLDVDDLRSAYYRELRKRERQ
ncbi:MAG: hypothetical protein ABFS45_15250 [Pseudomonadota bacterium]